jgi:hypothetical protein
MTHDHYSQYFQNYKRQVFRKLVCEQILSFLENEIVSMAKQTCCEVYYLYKFFPEIFVSLFADKSNFWHHSEVPI